MACQRCGSERVIKSSGKTSDCFGAKFADKPWTDGYVPYDLGIGGGDYRTFSHCLACGQIQGKWPLPTAEIEAGDE